MRSREWAADQQRGDKLRPADPDEGMMQAYLIFGSWLCSGFCYGPYCCLVRLMA